MAGPPSAPDQPPSATQLQRLRAAIVHEHDAAITSACTAIEHAVACGKALIEAKKLVGHGGWISWIETNLPFGQRQTAKYAALARAALANRNSEFRFDAKSIDRALETLRHGARLREAGPYHPPTPKGTVDLRVRRQLVQSRETDIARTAGRLQELELRHGDGAVGDAISRIKSPTVFGDFGKVIYEFATTPILRPVPPTEPPSPRERVLGLLRQAAALMESEFTDAEREAVDALIDRLASSSREDEG
jgi:hypothetical protein